MLKTENNCSREGGGTEVHLSGYQRRDYEVVDYRMYRQKETGLQFRGPEPKLRKRDYVSCLGAAQTFGCWCETPFPDLLSSRFNTTFANFGYGGAGPAFFLKYPELLKIVNRGKLAILQVMSGRSEDNDLFDSGGLEYLTIRSNGTKTSAQRAYTQLLSSYQLPQSVPAPLAKAIRMFRGPEELRKVIKQTQDNWVASNLELLELIEVPVVLFWFSRRSPQLNHTKKFVWNWQRYDNVNSMFGDYPQFVNQRMVRQVKSAADVYVYCKTKRGSPQPLYSRFTGEPALYDSSRDRPDLAYDGPRNLRPENAYYPSPEMHEDAAMTLEPVLRELL